MLKNFKARLQQYVNHELPDVQDGFRKAEEPETKLPHLLDHRKSKRVPEKYPLLLYCLCQRLCVDHNKLLKILKEMGLKDHLICLLRNLYAGQAATVRTGQGTTDWF